MWVSLISFASLSLALPLTSTVPVAPLFSSPYSEPIPNQYIVVFNKETTPQQKLSHFSLVNSFVPPATPLSLASLPPHHLQHKKQGYGLHSVFDIDHDISGYVATLDDSHLNWLRLNEDIAFIEHDQIVYANELETDAPWGLGRVSHRDLPDDKEMHHYSYDSDAGNNVIVYVVDTGINIHHVDFEGRASWGATIPEGDADVDGNGHGTHVAGTCVGKTYGVAKKAKVKAIKVLRSNGSGTMSDVVRGVEWVATDHKGRQVAEDEAADTAGKERKNALSVANMSLGGGRSRALDLAVNSVVKAGVHFAVAAGNDNRDACNYSPAAADKAITVGASTVEDDRAWFSNWGKCVDIFAPGHQILSAWIGSSTATNTISGTSMASPHVCGVVAELLSKPKYANLTTDALKKKLAKISTKDVIDMGMIPPWSGKTKNMLVWSDPPPHEDESVPENVAKPAEL